MLCYSQIALSCIKEAFGDYHVEAQWVGGWDEARSCIVAGPSSGVGWLVVFSPLALCQMSLAPASLLSGPEADISRHHRSLIKNSF